MMFAAGYFTFQCENYALSCCQLYQHFMGGEGGGGGVDIFVVHITSIFINLRLYLIKNSNLMEFKWLKKNISKCLRF